MCNACTGHSKKGLGLSGSPLSLREVEGTLGIWTIFKERALNSTDSRGSKGALCRACKTKERSKECISCCLWELKLRNLIIRSCFLRDFPFTASWCAAVGSNIVPCLWKRRFFHVEWRSSQTVQQSVMGKLQQSEQLYLYFGESTPYQLDCLWMKPRLSSKHESESAVWLKLSGIWPWQITYAIITVLSVRINTCLPWINCWNLRWSLHSVHCSLLLAHGKSCWSLLHFRTFIHGFAVLHFSVFTHRWNVLEKCNIIYLRER